MVQAAVDRGAIVATMMDYFEGWFDGDAERMERALHADLDKCGVRFERTPVGWRIVNALFMRRSI
jgi:hypothetical protein